MFNLRVPRNLQLSQDLSPEEVSQAWDYLNSLPLYPVASPDEPLPCPPNNLKNLSDADWFLLDNLLQRELLLKQHSKVH